MFQKGFFKILVIAIMGVVVAAGVLIYTSKYLILPQTIPIPIPTSPLPPTSTQEAVCVYQDGSCCQKQGACNEVMVTCENGFRADIKGCNEKCEAVFECVPDVSDWKTYRNEKYSYELKYPRDAQIEAETEKGILIKLPLATATTAKETLGKRFAVKAAEKFTPEKCSHPTEAFSLDSIVEIKKIESIRLGTIDFFKEISESQNFGMIEYYASYSTAKTNQCFLAQAGIGFFGTPPPDLDQERELEIIEQILSTFRFLE